MGVLGRLILNLLDRLVAWLLVGFFGFGWGYVLAAKGAELETFGSVAAGIVGFVLVVAAFEWRTWHQDRKHRSRGVTQFRPKMLPDHRRDSQDSGRIQGAAQGFRM